MTMNKFHFNEHKQDTWECDWLIRHIISIKGEGVGQDGHGAKDRSDGQESGEGRGEADGEMSGK